MLPLLVLSSWSVARPHQQLSRRYEVEAESQTVVGVERGICSPASATTSIDVGGAAAHKPSLNTNISAMVIIMWGTKSHSS